MIKDYFSLGIKNLRRRGVRSWLTLLGIIIGIAAVVSLISLGDGLKTAVNSQFGISTTQALTVQAGGVSGYGPPGTGVVKPLTKDDSDAIERLSEVEVAIPRNIQTLKVEFNNKANFGYAASIIEGYKRQYIYDITELEAESGRLLKDGDSYKIMVGNNLGDENKNGFGKAMEVGNKITVQGKQFEIVGILKKKGSFVFDNAFYIDDKPLREIANIGDRVDVIAVKVKDKDLMDKTKEDIEQLLRRRRDVKIGEEDFSVSTPQATLATVNQILGGVQAFIVIIAFASILVGAIGIINTMTTSVLERKKEIGVMKAIGAQNKDIFLQFFIEAGLLGFVGGLIGVLIGSAIGFAGISVINGFLGISTAPKISMMLIASTLLGGFLIGSISGIAPAMQAARQKPVDALRS